MYKYTCSIEATKDNGKTYDSFDNITVPAKEQLTHDKITKQIVTLRLPLEYTSWRNLTYTMENTDGQ